MKNIKEVYIYIYREREREIGSVNIRHIIAKQIP